MFDKLVNLCYSFLNLFENKKKKLYNFIECITVTGLRFFLNIIIYNNVIYYYLNFMYFLILLLTCQAKFVLGTSGL